MEKETDLNALARMVANGFASIEKRFDNLEGRVDGLEDRFDSLEKRFDVLEAKVDETNRLIDTAILPALDEHAHRIKVLEEHAA